MSITKTFLAGAAGLMLASGVAAANEPTKLSPAEMDQVTAGAFAVAGIGPFAILGVAGGIENETATSAFSSLKQGTSGIPRFRAGANAFASTQGFVVGFPLNEAGDGEATFVAPFGFATVGFGGNS